MFDEGKLQFGHFVTESMKAKILDSFTSSLGQLESGTLSREETPEDMDYFIDLLTVVEKKLCLEKFG